MWKSQPPVPVNVTLCENRVFADDRVRKVTVGEPWSNATRGPRHARREEAEVG